MQGEGDQFLVPDAALEAKIRVKGTRLLAMMKGASARPILSKGWLLHQLMEWTFQDPSFKTALFRFIDLLPSLDSNQALYSHLCEYLTPTATAGKPGLQKLLRLGKWAPGVTGGLLRKQLHTMARQFVAGENEQELAVHFLSNAAHGLATTIDLLGEAVLTAEEANAFLLRNLNMLSAMDRELALHPKPAASDIGVNGVVLPRLNLSLKISALIPSLDPTAPDRALAELKERLRPIVHHAVESRAHIHFDMEHYALKELTLRLFESLFAEDEFRKAPSIGIVIQAYLRESEADLQRLAAWAERLARPISIRLVKGAYWDSELLHAGQEGWPIPVWRQKAESDAQFEKLSLFLLERAELLNPAFASHNVRSLAHAMAQADRLGVDPRRYEFQTLYGMAAPLKEALLQSGYRVREYCPVGELLPGMAYLVRRLLENSSNEGFLHALDTSQETGELLQNPVERLSTSSRPPPLGPSQREEDFSNSPAVDFTRPGAYAPIEHASSALALALQERYPLVIGGKKYSPPDFLPSSNPAHPDAPLALWGSGGRAEAEEAVKAAAAAQPGWGVRSVTERAHVLERLGSAIEAKRSFFTALITLEAGKPVRDADAEVSEAIDFCHFYAAEMRRLGEPGLTQAVPGEENRLHHLPRGVAAIIAPWNFPLAILCGMSVAALVAGNSIVVKPAEQTPVVAAEWFALLNECGLPPGVANLVMGLGEIVGAHLVAHPKVAIIAFTGSKEVGLSIWELAAKTLPQQANLKKVVCEMGGKNAVIIDSSADLDEAIPALLASAFGYAGQKCSAASRAIVVGEIAEPFTRRLIQAAAEVPVGNPFTPGTLVGPVIDSEARRRILDAIKKGQAEATLAYHGSAPAEGNYVAPAIFTNVPTDSFLAKNEIFGPVLSLFKVDTIGEAITLANATPYALTGGIFSRTPSSLERARQELRVGNLYINRGITGAIVERQPFGGFGMSGSGTKAGGTSYLENFLFQKVVTENRIRRGFSEELL